MNNVTTVVQGIDPSSCNPALASKDLFKDRFVVFSGGKFEYRKGNDIVIKAYKVLQDKHKDVMLVNSWYNAWPFSLETMAMSQHIRFSNTSENHIVNMNNMLMDNGIDVSRVITLPSCPHSMMPKIYQNCDVGLFPNRCEGGTNLVLMEFMACGKPVIASYNSGHKDVVDKHNALLIQNMKEVFVSNNGQPYATWDDPDVDEAIYLLQWAYEHRDELATIGQQAGQDMSQFTWKRSAEDFCRLLNLSRPGGDAPRRELGRGETGAVVCNA